MDPKSRRIPLHMYRKIEMFTQRIVVYISTLRLMLPKCYESLISAPDDALDTLHRLSYVSTMYGCSYSEWEYIQQSETRYR